MDPTALVLEMTENIIIEDTERALTVLADLKDLGVRLALDDFGTGYSSLSYLRRLPIAHRQDRPELHRRHRPRPRGRCDRRGRHGTWRMSSGSAVTAEGVETRVQRDEVSAIGCEFAQGYYYARPMPASAIAAQLTAASQGHLRLPSPASQLVMGH